MRRSLAFLLLGIAVVASACGSESQSDEFDAGPADRFALTSITTFTDGDVAELATQTAAEGERVLDGSLVLHLVRLESGDFIALSARDPGSECWVPWQPEFEFDGRPGWFRDPCAGSVYDEQGTVVAGPSPRDLGRYPVEVRNGNVYVHVAEDSLIPGEVRAVTDSTSTPPTEPTPAAATPTTTPAVEETPTPSPSPAPEPTSTPTPTPEATATATGTATASPTPAVTPTPGLPALLSGSPYDEADFRAALADEDLDFGPQGVGNACEGAGAEAVAYGTAGFGGDDDWPGMTLWVYSSPQALRADWELPDSGPPSPTLDGCTLASTMTYWNGNLLLVLDDAEAWRSLPALRERVRDAFLSIG